MLLIKSEEKHVHRFEKKVVKYRKFTDEGRAKFRSLMTLENWDSVRRGSPSDGANELNSLLTAMLDECFPWGQFTVKSTDPPWINNDIRRCAKKKRRMFRLEGRGPNYRRLQKEMDLLQKKAKSDFLAGIKADILVHDNTSAYYKAVKTFSGKGVPTPWDVRDMMPGKTDAERCEEIACYFNRISDEFIPLPCPVHDHTDVREPPALYRIAALSLIHI